MYEIEEKSARLAFAETVIEFITENGVTLTNGGIKRGIDRKNRAYYSIAFSCNGSDGVISIYSEKYFVVKYKTKNEFMPPSDRILIKRQDQLFAFLTAAFIDVDEEAYQNILSKL